MRHLPRNRMLALGGAVGLAMAALSGGAIAADATPQVPAAAVAPSGAWTVSYLSGPSHSLTAQQCLSFTAGSILGFTKSGTWVATTFGGFGGNYVLDGKDLRFYGTFNSGSGVIAHHAGFNKTTGSWAGGFDDFAPSAPPSAINDGRITLTPGCTAAAAPRPSGDPTR